MAVPQITGTYSAHLGTGGTAVLDISGIGDGAWMVVTIMSSAASMVITPPSGWTALTARVVSGTRSNFVFAKIKASSDGTTATFTQSAAVSTSYGFMWGIGAADIVNWAVGAPWVRATNSLEPSGARFKNIAPSITTTEANSLVLAVSNEATLAMAQANEITNISPSGWTERLRLEQVAPSDRIETIWIGSKDLTTPAATGDVTLTYSGEQDNNGFGLQLAIPATAPPTSAVPYVVGASTSFVGSSNTGFTINRPSGAVDGDYVMVVFRGQNSTCTVEPSSTGFTRLGPAFVSSSASYRMDGFYGRAITNAATEPTSYTFSFTCSGTSNRIVAVAFLVRSVDLAAPLAGYSNDYGGTSLSGGRRVEDYPVTSSPSLALFMGAAEFASPNDHIPTSLPTTYSAITSEVTTTNLSSSRTYLWVGGKEATATVPADSIQWTTPSGYAAEGIALKGVNSAAEDPAGIGAVVADGTGTPVRMYHTTASGARTPRAIVPMRRGFHSVAESLAVHGVTWAHRGGSSSYPEMSLYGYTQSVMRGYGVLEVSLARTSDGVWFGLHDSTTDRTSGGTYGNASTQTWAQIQAQRIVIGPGGPQPYMRWDEIIAIYGSTHVIVADPKYALGGYRTEFLNMVYNDLGPSRAIIKYSGVGSGAAALAIAARDMGFETWGFFYAGDASAAQGGNGNLQTWGGNWTILGMEYGASQAIWDEVLAFGKPVMGHIAPNQAAYDMAMAKGASGVQVSGVAAVAPVSWWNQ